MSDGGAIGVGLYPRRPAPDVPGPLDAAVRAVTAAPLQRWRARIDRGFARSVLELEPSFAALSDQALLVEITAVARALRRGRHRSEQIRAFAATRECSARHLGLRHFPTQIMAGHCLLNGAIVEMQTGEGKTLAGTLPAAAAALSGTRVHVITANDYLAERDAAAMAPVYQALGLSVAAVKAGMPREARREAYGCDVTYAAGKEVAFDYLRDRVAMGARSGDLQMRLGRFLDGRPLTLRGPQMAIVDEADSVMIDEARTPLILSAEPTTGALEAEVARRAHELATALVEGRDFAVDRPNRQVRLTNAGRAALEIARDVFPGAWRAAPMREEAVRTALSALYLHRRGADYIVRDGKVEIVDEYTGRVMPDRTWSWGLHQAVELKEGCELTSRRETLAQITFQRFFRRYLHLAGMSGTAREAAREFGRVYDRPVVTVAPHKPSRRRTLPARVLPDANAKWRAVAQAAAHEAGAGRAVLIGTRTVEASRSAGAALARLGVPHRILNAAQDAEEAAIVAEAGAPGAVTVATNMAGRGTDILLSEGVPAAGGLHVILTERHAARRIDRQLAGRCGRQGDPGSVQAILSAEDQILEQLGGGPWRALVRVLGPAALPLFSAAQKSAERRHARARRKLLKLDARLGETLAFTGPQE